jgi:hypothetical protein
MELTSSIAVPKEQPTKAILDWKYSEAKRLFYYHVVHNTLLIHDLIPAIAEIIIDYSHNFLQGYQVSTIENKDDDEEKKTDDGLDSGVYEDESFIQSLLKKGTRLWSKVGGGSIYKNRYRRNAFFDLIHFGRLHHGKAFGGTVLKLIRLGYHVDSSSSSSTKNNKNTIMTECREYSNWNMDLDLCFTSVENVCNFIKMLELNEWTVFTATDKPSSHDHRKTCDRHDHDHYDHHLNDMSSIPIKMKQSFAAFFQRLRVRRKFYDFVGMKYAFLDIYLDIVVPKQVDSHVITNDFEMNSLTYDGIHFGTTITSTDKQKSSSLQIVDRIINDIVCKKLVKFAPSALTTIIQAQRRRNSTSSSSDNENSHVLNHYRHLQHRFCKLWNSLHKHFSFSDRYNYNNYERPWRVDLDGVDLQQNNDFFVDIDSLVSVST